MRRPLLVLLVALACPPLARADLVDFSYRYTVGTNYLYASGPGPISLSSTTNADGGFTVDHGNGTVTFALAPGGNASATPGDAVTFGPASSIPLGTFAAATKSGPAGAFSYSSSFYVGLHLTDTASGQSGEVSMYGYVYGDTSIPGSSSYASVYAYGGWWWWDYPTLTLGDHAYSVFVDPNYAELTPDGLPGALAVNVYVDGPMYDYGYPDGVPVPAAAPEPSSLLLGGSALALLGLARLRRRQPRTK